MVSARLLEPPALLLWLATGTRRLSLHWLRLSLAAILALLWLGPAASAVPAASADPGGALPPPLLGTGLHPQPISGPAAERLLGSPLLDSAALHQQTRDLGIWATTLDGPYGHTVVIFRVLDTNRQTWLTVLELRSERPLGDSPWDMIVAQPTVVGGRPAKLYDQPGSTTVAWQETPTLHVSLSEDSQQPRSQRISPGPTDIPMLSQGQFLALAASLHPRGVQVGPFRLDLPW
jgi:hypothetical protein